MNRSFRRRDFLRAVLAGTAGGVAGCGSSSNPGTDADGNPASGTPGGDGSPGTDPDPDETPADRPVPGSVGLETLASGLRAPVSVAFAPDADRRYVAEQPGRVLVHEDGLREQPLLDLRDAVSFGGERGLLGLALHPDFPDDRRLFVRYSAPPREGTPADYSHTFVLAEFRVDEDGRRADPDSERTVLEIPEPQGNHNAGDVAFGPDGYCYVPVGDGGAANDQGRGHVSDWYGAVAGGNGQDVSANLLGSILRIDVDGDRPYAVPEDNPLVGEAGLDEQYAWGFRNPWRLSFDGDRLFVGDVGQSGYEEVNLVEKGGNYGWNVREGSRCFQADDCPDATPTDVRGGEPLRDPIVEYPHASQSDAPLSGRSVIGGNVYRGSELAGLAGRYVFGDLQARGRLFVASPPDDGGRWPTTVVSVTDADALDRLFSFGRDRDGEVYVLAEGADGGGLHRVVPA